MKKLFAILLVLAFCTTLTAEQQLTASTTDEYVNFVAVDATDFHTRETGLASFTVYYSINSGAATAMTTPTTSELDNTNMPGVYTLLVDEVGMTTLPAGNYQANLVLHITKAGMDPVTLSVLVRAEAITEPGIQAVVTAANTAIGLDATLCTNLGTTNTNVATTMADVAATHVHAAGAETSAISAAAYAVLNSGLLYRVTASAPVSRTVFTATSLVGLGAGAFVPTPTNAYPWYAYVFAKNDGTGTAPQGEQVAISAFNSATGAFTLAGTGFTVALTAGDVIFIEHPGIAQTIALADVKADTTLLTNATYGLNAIYNWCRKIYDDL